MRWERLFDDLSSQFDADEAGELAGEVSERTRIETNRLGLVDRLRGALGTGVTVAVAGQRLPVRVMRVAADAVVAAGGAGELLVPVAAIDWIEGLERTAVPARDDPVANRLGLRSLIRAIARDRRPVHLLLRDRTTSVGTLDVVGEDWLEVALHAEDEPRRTAAVTAYRVIPFSALGYIRSL